MKWIKINESSTDTEFKNEVRKMSGYLKSIEPQRKKIASQLQKIFDMVHSSHENEDAFRDVCRKMNMWGYGISGTYGFIDFAPILSDMDKYYQEHNGDINNYLPMDFDRMKIKPSPDMGDEYDIRVSACEAAIKSRNYNIGYEDYATHSSLVNALRAYLKMSSSEIEERGIDACVKMLFLKFVGKGYMEKGVNSAFEVYDELIPSFIKLFEKITGKKIGGGKKPNKLPSWHIDYDWSVDGGEINKEQGDYEAETEKDAIKMLKRELRDQIENEYPDYEDIDFNIINVRQN